MPPYRRVVLLALGLVLALLAGCSAESSADDRVPGSPITADEAEVLAGLLHRNYTEGGADFVLTAPYAQGTVLTMTGAVDFARGIGRADAVTTFGDGRPEDSRTLWFTPQDLWFGNVPGLTDALAEAGAPGIQYMRRPIATVTDGTASLVDVLAQMVPKLSARADDDPRALLERDYTWQGQRSIDGRLAASYRTGTGAEIAVSAEDELLLQYVTRLPDQDFDVTITLADQGPRDVALPPDPETATAADFPQVAADLGI